MALDFLSPFELEGKFLCLSAENGLYNKRNDLKLIVFSPDSRPEQGGAVDPRALPVGLTGAGVGGRVPVRLKGARQGRHCIRGPSGVVCNSVGLVALWVINDDVPKLVALACAG